VDEGDGVIELVNEPVGENDAVGVGLLEVDGVKEAVAVSVAVGVFVAKAVAEGVGPGQHSAAVPKRSK